MSTRTGHRVRRVDRTVFGLPHQWPLSTRCGLTRLTLLPDRIRVKYSSARWWPTRLIELFVHQKFSEPVVVLETRGEHDDAIEPPRSPLKVAWRLLADD